MGIRTGAQYRESLRDGRTIYVNGERVKDVTTYPAFRGIIDTLAALYDLQREHQALLTYPSLALPLVKETDRGMVVHGARMLSTLAPFSNELWVGPFHPRKPGDEPYTLCFAVPMDTPGLKFVCREPYDSGRSAFDRPLSSRFDEEDALTIFDNVLVPWERVFIKSDIEASNAFNYSTNGSTPATRC